MSIAALTLSRTPNSLATARTVRSIGLSQEQLNRLQMQLGSGVKFQKPSESPTAATQTIALQKLDERRAAFQTSLQTNMGFLSVADQSLGTISDALAQARGLLQAGLGDQVTTEEREGLAQEVAALMRSLVQSANTTYNGRAIFAGSATAVAPFEQLASGLVRYNGNGQTLAGFADFDTLVASGIDGINGLQATTTTSPADLNPNVTLATRLDQLHRGQGVELGSLRVVVDGAVTDYNETIDLSRAETLQDVKNRIEAAFPAGVVTVGINAAGTGLSIAAAGTDTVQVRDLNAGTTALDLGLRGGPLATVEGTDLDAALSLLTPLSALNGGTGVDLAGLRIDNAGTVTTVDLTGAATVQDVLSRIRAAEPNVIAEISADGRGISVTSRLNGGDFSIGENGGSTAADLGLRTFSASTRLADLNLGVGVPGPDAPPLTILRRDGTEVSIDLSAAASVQDVLDALNAAGFTAGLNATGNGIALQDTSGGGPLTVVENDWSLKLGLNGTETTGGALTGRDVNPQQAAGGFNVLARLEQAIRDRDLPAMNRLSGELDAAYNHVIIARGELGNHQRQLESIDDLLEDRHLQIKERLATIQDVDLSVAITEFLAQQQSMQAYLQIASQTLQVSILQYL